jgi:hypothetical protein
MRGKKGDMVWHAGEAYSYSSFAGFVKETGKCVIPTYPPLLIIRIKAGGISQNILLV